MIKLAIFSLGEKGYSAIINLVNLPISISIECIIGEDANVSDDYSRKLRNFCELHKIKYYFCKEPLPSIEKYDFFIAIGWRWMLRDLPLGKLIILHDSLLPKYRGFAPLVNALLNKEKTIGVTALLGAEEYDKGNILLQYGINVSYPTQIGIEMQRISDLYSCVAVELVQGLASGSIDKKGQPQNECDASYSLWRGEDDYRIDWKDSAENIEHFINCLNAPYRGASSLLKGELIRVLKGRAINDVKIENRTSGKVIFIEKNFPVVVCGKGLLLLEEALSTKGESILPLATFRSKFC